MVVAVLAGLDQLGHAVPGDAGVLELVARRADGHVEAGEVGAVVDRDPVVRAVVEVGKPARLAWDAERRQRDGPGGNLRLPLLPRHAAQELIGIVDPLMRIAGGILRSQQQRVADIGAEVDAEIAVRDVQAIALEIPAGRRGNVVHLVAQRARAARHALFDARHAIDEEAVRAGHVDDHGRRDLRSVGRATPATRSNVRRMPVTARAIAEARTVCGRGGSDVVTGEGWIVDVSRAGREDRAFELALRLGPEFRILGSSRRPELARVEASARAA